MGLIGAIHRFEHSSTGYVRVVGEEGDLSFQKPTDWELLVRDWSREDHKVVGPGYFVTYEELGICFDTTTEGD